MIMKNGIQSILHAFGSVDSGLYKITRIELGDDTGGDIIVPVTLDTPLTEFSKVMEYELKSGDIQVIANKTMKLLVTVHSDDVLSDVNSVIPFTSIRLIQRNGEIFAWRRFPTRVIANGYRMALEWDLRMDEICWEE